MAQWKQFRCPTATTAPTLPPQQSTAKSLSREPDTMTDSAPQQLAGWRHVYSGKVRNLYEPADSEPGASETLLVVATDRISAFDHILSPGIPDKGKILTQLSLRCFRILPLSGMPGDRMWRSEEH